MNRVAVVVRAAVAVAAVGAIALARPAGADCVAAEVAVHRAGHSSVTVVPNTCLVPTPWPRRGAVGADYRDDSMPTAAPNGADAWVFVAYP